MRFFFGSYVVIFLSLCFGNEDESSVSDKRGRAGSREKRFFPFLSHSMGNQEDIENIKADVESAKFILDAVQSTSVTKDELEVIQNALSHQVKVCPLNRRAVHVGDSCYEYFPLPLTFPQARQVCRALGGDLASIDLQQNFLSKLRYFYPRIAIDGTRFETWLGATRIPETRNFQFFDGTVLYSSNARWNNGPRNHNCLILDDVDLVQEFIIDDCDCFNRRPFLCQYDVIHLIAST